MTDMYITDTIRTLLQETHVRRETEKVLNNVVEAVEYFQHEQEARHIHKELQQLREKCKEEHIKIVKLEETTSELQRSRAEIKKKATQAKEKFIVDISQVLRESKNIHLLRERLKEMDKKLLLTSRLETELAEAKKRIKELEREKDPNKKKRKSIGNDEKVASAAASVSSVKIPHNLLINVEESFLMNAFSYLSTKDVIYTAQASRYLYKKVDTMFSIGSPLCKPEWALMPTHYTSQPSSLEGSTSTTGNHQSNPNTPSRKEVIGGGGGGAGSGIVGLTKQMAEDLSKKLSAPELKTILSMMDNQKKLSAQLQTSQAEHMQMKEKLESTEGARDFLVGKLKDAEFAIKSAMSEQLTLQKQAETDHEVIFYLDNQSQQLESENKELRWKCGQLEASLDLLRGSHTINEKQTMEELHELRDRLDVSETAAKSQKKILVKEVKTLRSQLDSVKEERDSYWRKLQIMKETLNTTDDNGNNVERTSSISPSQVKTSIVNKVYSVKSSLFK